MHVGGALDYRANPDEVQASFDKCGYFPAVDAFFILSPAQGVQYTLEDQYEAQADAIYQQHWKTPDVCKRGRAV